LAVQFTAKPVNGTLPGLISCTLKFTVPFFDITTSPDWGLQ